MRVPCTALALAGVVSLWPARAGARTFVTLSDVRKTARERALQIATVHLGLAEAQGRVGGASVRIAGATARPAVAIANADETTRSVVRDAARFYHPVFAAERIRRFKMAEILARPVFDTADRRDRDGDISFSMFRLLNPSAVGR